MSPRLTVVTAAAILSAVFLAARIYIIQHDETVAAASKNRGQYKISEVREYASIYDCKGVKLNNTETIYRAVIDPNDESALKALPYIADREVYSSGITGNLPFLCTVTQGEIDGVPVIFEKTVRTSADMLAAHIVGYRSDGEGVCGLEYAYNKFIRENYSKNTAEYTVNAVGGVLEGLYSAYSQGETVEAGVITTIDAGIQKICESAVEKSGCESGAVIVMDVKSGEIRACVSFPQFNPENPAENLEDENSPFVNKAFSAYTVGSIFKLVTSAAALECGISPEYTYNCDGSIDVDGQIFNCHKWGGHGEIDMYQAVEYSCNPYFIALSEYIGEERLHDTAAAFGFGEETSFCRGMTSAAGYLTSAEELSVPAERGNFSFGQGKLTATPLQICRMTATIANGGMSATPKLVLALKNEDGSLDEYSYPVNRRVISNLTAQKLSEFMVRTVNAENSMSQSYMVSSAGKTSTAQTGRYNSDGSEIMNCWFTGFFPVDEPKYAVTVMVENGYSGNATAAPIYKNIAERVTIYEK
ncbi:MAG: peptidoglycan D,D-transpeptidase FtsI family protein [Oscillospiraceae bacterium]